MEAETKEIIGKNTELIKCARVYQIHYYLLSTKTENKILVSSAKCGILKQIRRYCTSNTFNIYNPFCVYKRTIQQTLHLNKDTYVHYNYNEEYVW